MGAYKIVAAVIPFLVGIAVFASLFSKLEPPQDLDDFMLSTRSSLRRFVADAEPGKDTRKFFTKRLRVSLARNGLNQIESLDLENRALSRIADKCTSNELVHFPKVIEYVRGEFLKQTSQGISIYAYDQPMVANLTRVEAEQQIATMLQCLNRASVWHLDFETGPSYCKNVALDEETGTVISIIDFDVCNIGSEPMNGDIAEHMDRYNGSWEVHSQAFAAELAKCVLGERDSAILGSKKARARKKANFGKVKYCSQNEPCSRRHAKLDVR
mmetsp:Transcript_31201/g.67554  ORF Transcript_31201/g.67554 Transcript_31201/m.67554 type:complete len:270 (+) Transcript_31201:68-877(+)